MEEKTLNCPYCGKPLEIAIAKTRSLTDTRTLIDQLKRILGKTLNNLDVVEENEAVIITPKGFLGRELWQQINDALKPFGPEWISAKKESRWVIHVRDVE
jgi:hypothetical protein